MLELCSSPIWELAKLVPVSSSSKSNASRTRGCDFFESVGKSYLAMNKSYKTVWNESLSAWVAVSEIGGVRGKRSRNRKTAAAVAAALMLTMGPAQNLHA